MSIMFFIQMMRIKCNKLEQLSGFIRAYLPAALGSHPKNSIDTPLQINVG